MSLDLDTRQRAILQEMGIRVWLPAPIEAEPVARPTPAPQRMAALPPRADQPARTAAPQVAEQTAKTSSATPINPAASPPARPQTATESVAAYAASTGATAKKSLRTPVKLPPTGTPLVLAAGIADMDWPTLANTLANCQACQLCTDRKATVFGAATAPDAPRRADWLVVGEPPDDTDERLGAPFADPSGQLLDNMLKAVGVSQRTTLADAASQARVSAYVTNVVKCRPATVRNPTPAELAVCENYLRREVALVQPKIILAMGRFAAQTLLHGSLPEGSKIPFGKLRGQIYRYQGIPVVVTYHPTYLLRNPHEKARAWADLCLALDVVQRGQ